MPQRIEISYKTILFAIGVLAAIWLLIQIRTVLLLLFVSLILVSALHSPVDWLQKRKVPRALAILFLYVVIIGVLTGAFSIIIPPFVEQTRALFNRLPGILEQINKLIVFYKIPTEDIVSQITSEFGLVGANFLRVTAGFFTSLVGVITLAVFTFYLLLEWQNVVNLAASAFSGKTEKQVKKLLNAIRAGLGGWVRGELTLMIIVGGLSYLGLFLLGIPSALPLAIFAGFLEIIPIIGPLVAAIPAVLAGLLVSPVLAAAVVALYFIIQQVENNLIVPNVMAKAVGINPLITIIALMIGAQLAGFVGIIVAVPVAVAVKIILAELGKPVGEEVPE